MVSTPPVSALRPVQRSAVSSSPLGDETAETGRYQRTVETSLRPLRPSEEKESCSFPFFVRRGCDCSAGFQCPEEPEKCGAAQAKFVFRDLSKFGCRHRPREQCAKFSGIILLHRRARFLQPRLVT